MPAAKPLKISKLDEYIAVIFTTTTRADCDLDDYGKWAEHMEELVQNQPGYLGMDHARSEVGITISYWKNEESVNKWRRHPEHSEAQKNGINKFYESYALHVCKVYRNNYFES